MVQAQMPPAPSIKLDKVFVSGVDTVKRASNIKQWLLRRGRLSQDIRVPILSDISLSIGVGERIGIVGGNGSGKSSLLKVIAGIYPPLTGQVDVVGKTAPLIEMGIGFDGEMTGRENIKVGLLYSGRSEEYSVELENKIIEFTELGDRIDQPLKVYSSGMRARLCFAVSVFQHPDILLLDEAFATGDSSFIGKAYSAMVDRFTSVPIAILVTHAPELVTKFCTRCLWMKHGRIIADGDPKTIVAQYEREAA